MNILLLVVALIILLFGFVILFGAPYLPTMAKQRQQALDLLNLSKGQILIELGSGDGRMLIAAANRGLNVIGYELNPILYLFSKVLCFRYRKSITIHYGNFWHKKWPQADGIYVFLHTRFMSRLHKKITQQYHGHKVKIVTYAFKIPDKPVSKTKDALFLYEYY